MKKFGVFSDEELASLTNKNTFDVKFSLLFMKEILVPKYFFYWKYKRILENYLKILRPHKEIYLTSKKYNYIFKRFLLDLFFEIDNKNLSIETAINIITKNWDKFVLKNLEKQNNNVEVLKDLLGIALNSQFIPFTDNEEVFDNEVKEFLQTFKDLEFLELIENLILKLFVFYAV